MITDLIEWYEINKRDLPWRHTRDPYRIWVSEIILQQTRVDQGLPYYYNFITQFPDIQSLAAAPEDQVLKAWQGLGYYSRARNMMKAAAEICEKFNGEFPADIEKLRSVKGIGPYTAAAVGSFAFGLPFPAIDGNVRRVGSRWFGISLPAGSPASDKLLNTLLIEKMRGTDPGIFNQAMIELGAMVCKPGQPDCGSCPLRMDCEACKQGRQSEWPVVPRKKTPAALHLDFMFLESDGHTWIHKRDDSGIWKGLYEFPVKEVADHQGGHPFGEWFSEPGQVSVLACSHFRHQLTHRTIFARLWHLSAPPYIIVEQKENVRIPLRNMADYPVHRLMTAFLKEHEITI